MFIFLSEDTGECSLMQRRMDCKASVPSDNRNNARAGILLGPFVMRLLPSSSAARTAGFYTSDNPTDKLSTLILESGRIKAERDCFVLAARLQRRGNECKVECISTMRQNHCKLKASLCDHFIYCVIHFFSLS